MVTAMLHEPTFAAEAYGNTTDNARLPSSFSGLPLSIAISLEIIS
jgi:hypothetical protein